MDSKRTNRVSGLLREKLGEIFLKDLKDPLVKLVTVTRVKVSPDLKYATVLVSFLGEKSQKENGLKGLERAKSFIRSELGSRTSLRHVPELRFVYDDGVDYAQKIESILDKIRAEENGGNRDS
jgi:ribosome-binding factor A